MRIKRGDHVITAITVQEKDLVSYARRIKTEHINGRTINSFLELLKEERKSSLTFTGMGEETKRVEITRPKTDVVIDVRYNTFFKRDFSPELLKDLLQKNGVQYFYVQALGNPYHNREITSQEMKRTYLSYLEKTSFTIKKETVNPRQALADLYYIIAHKQEFKQKMFLIICYCKTREPMRCHRFWLKEKLFNLKRIELGLPGNFELI